MKTSLDHLGKWPVAGDEARKKNRMIYLPKEKWLNLIHGKENHILMSFFVSNDFCHFGKLKIPKGIHSDPETHKGDEVLFVLSGSLTIQVYEEGESEATVLHETFEVNEHEQFLIPEGFKHRYLNFSDEVVEAIFGIAPEL
jgi:dTDP-4-dehydrorhamnose 3,5-epimerase-like enzyme